MPTLPRLVRRAARGRITRVVLVALLLALAGVPVTAAAQPEAPLADTAKRADWATVQALLLQGASHALELYADAHVMSPPDELVVTGFADIHIQCALTIFFVQPEAPTQIAAIEQGGKGPRPRLRPTPALGGVGLAGGTIACAGKKNARNARLF